MPIPCLTCLFKSFPDFSQRRTPPHNLMRRLKIRPGCNVALPISRPRFLFSHYRVQCSAKGDDFCCESPWTPSRSGHHQPYAYLFVFCTFLHKHSALTCPLCCWFHYPVPIPWLSKICSSTRFSLWVRAKEVRCLFALVVDRLCCRSAPFLLACQDRTWSALRYVIVNIFYGDMREYGISLFFLAGRSLEGIKSFLKLWFFVNFLIIFINYNAMLF